MKTVRRAKLFIILSVILLLAVFGCDKKKDYELEVPDVEYHDSKLKKYPGEGEIKILSFNVRYGTAKETNSSNNWSNRKSACVAMIKDQKPSCIGFQEAVYDIQFEYFKDQLKDEYDGYGVGRDDGKRSGECMGILWRKSEIKMIDIGTFWLSPTPDTPSKADSWDAACFRSATWGIFEVISTGQRFCYINTHLDHKGAKAREESMKLISKRFEQYNPGRLPQILSADFNASPSSAIFGNLSGMYNSRNMAPTGYSDENTTYHAWGTTAGSQIDNILFSYPATPKEYHTIVEPYESVAYLSDHYPIYAIFAF